MRNSSIELYRIIATFLVLYVHFNGWFLGGGEMNNTQAFIVSLCSICVNCFLVISGFFGIKLKVNSIINIISITFTAYIINAFLGIFFSNYSFFTFLKSISLSKESYYFQCYLMLVILSPILNSFIDKYKKNILPLVFVLFVTEFYIGWIRGNNCLGYNNGYGLTHFISMYLYGRTLYLFGEKSITKCRFLHLFILLTFSILGIYIMYMFLGAEKSFSYLNPLNILASFTLFSIFVKIKFNNKIVNYLSSSVFMVYMLHVCTPLKTWLSEFAQNLFNESSYSSYLMHISAFIIVYFIIAIFIDKGRQFVFKPIIIKFTNFIESYKKKISYE